MGTCIAIITQMRYNMNQDMERGRKTEDETKTRKSNSIECVFPDSSLFASAGSAYLPDVVGRQPHGGGNTQPSHWIASNRNICLYLHGCNAAHLRRSFHRSVKEEERIADYRLLGHGCRNIHG